jgi:WD40 repeat protein
LVDTRNANGSGFVVVVDQFEELFTECTDAEARTAFLENLAFAASHADRLVSVVLTLRNDFARAVQSPGAFVFAVRESRLIVQAMDRDELTEAIARPARELGHPWPPPLVENLVAQAEGRSGALPLLEFALKQLWTEHIACRIEEASWSSRLIEDFLVQAADALFETAGSSEEKRTGDQRIIRRAFLAMVQLGEGTPDTRRVAHLSEIIVSGDEPAHVHEVLAPFTAPEARLIAASEQEGETTYELTHEALISSWDRLRAWLGNVPEKAESERIRTDLRLHRRLSAAAAEWQAASSRDKSGYLLRNAQLVSSDGGLVLTKEPYSQNGDRTYQMRVCDTESGVELFRFSGNGGYDRYPWFHEWSEAVGAFTQNNRWIITEQKHTDPKSDRNIGSDIRLWDAQVTNPLLEFGKQTCSKDTYCGTEHTVVDRRGLRIATVGRAGNFEIWNALTGKKISEIDNIKLPVLDLAFSPDGHQIVAISYEWARVWNSDTGAVVHDLGAPGCCSQAVGFSSDGTRILSTGHGISVWDAKRGSLSKTVELDHSRPVMGMALNHRGTRLLALSHGADLIDTETGKAILHIPDEQVPSDVGEFDRAIGFSRDDSVMFVIGNKAGVAVWDASTGALLLGNVKRTFDSVLIGGAISPSGKFLLTISMNNSLPGIAQLWDVATGTELGRIEGHLNDVASAEFMPDGQRLAIGSAKGTARIIPLLPEDPQSLVDLACGRTRGEPSLSARWTLPRAYRALPADSRERFFLGPSAVGPCDRDGILSWR